MKLVLQALTVEARGWLSGFTVGSGRDIQAGAKATDWAQTFRAKELLGSNAAALQSVAAPRTAAHGTASHAPDPSRQAACVSSIEHSAVGHNAERITAAAARGESNS